MRLSSRHRAIYQSLSTKRRLEFIDEAAHPVFAATATSWRRTARGPEHPVHGAFVDRSDRSKGFRCSKSATRM
jgi:hypothetical protein